MLSALEMEAVGGSKYQRWTARERFQSNWEHTLICFCSESCHTYRRQNHHHNYTFYVTLLLPAQVCKLFTYSSTILNDLDSSVNNPDMKYSPLVAGDRVDLDNHCSEMRLTESKEEVFSLPTVDL